MNVDIASRLSLFNAVSAAASAAIRKKNADTKVLDPADLERVYEIKALLVRFFVVRSRCFSNMHFGRSFQDGLGLCVLVLAAYVKRWGL